MPKSVGFTWAIVVLCVGLCLSYAVVHGMSRVAMAIRVQDFSSSNSNTSASNPFRAVVPLSGDRFAVVTDYSISVYRVDGNGKVTRTDDVDLRFKQIQPERRPTPRSTPTPYPTTMPTLFDAQPTPAATGAR